jgi:hypothetical protein
MLGNVGRERARRLGGRGFGAVALERKSDDHADHVMLLHEREQLLEGEPLAWPTGEGGQRLGERLGLVGKREANTAGAGVYT